MKTAQRLLLESVDPATAHGPDCLRKTIAGVDVELRRNGCGHVIVTDDRGAHHDYQGARYAEIVASMETYFDMVEMGL